MLDESISHEGDRSRRKDGARPSVRAREAESQAFRQYLGDSWLLDDSRWSAHGSFTGTSFLIRYRKLRSPRLLLLPAADIDVVLLPVTKIPRRRRLRRRSGLVTGGGSRTARAGRTFTQRLTAEPLRISASGWGRKAFECDDPP